MNGNDIKIVFTDLDRTLLRDDNTFSAANLLALNRFKKKGIIVVIATGRNLFSARKVLFEELPIDYLMISSGCGIMEWKTKSVIYENHLSRAETSRIIKIMNTQRADFMIHHPIPENHFFDYVRNSSGNLDFERRIKLYQNQAKEMTFEPEIASQVIAIFNWQEIERFEAVKNEIDFLQVIRATSPLDHRSIWLEVFPRGVSKGHSAAWLCDRLEIARQYTIGVGNDFNDIDLLDFTQQSFVVANAPQELKEIYQVIESNQNDGFAILTKNITR